MRGHEISEYLKSNGFRYSVRKSKGEIYTDGISNIFVCHTSVNKNRNLLNLKSEVKKAIRKRDSMKPNLIIPAKPVESVDHRAAQIEFAKRMLQQEEKTPVIIPAKKEDAEIIIEVEKAEEIKKVEEVKQIESKEETVIGKRKKMRREFNPLDKELIMIRIKELVAEDSFPPSEIVRKLKEDKFTMSNGDPLEYPLIYRYIKDAKMELQEKSSPEPELDDQKESLELPYLFSAILKDRHLDAQKKIKLMLAYIGE